jgi:hypothetical protein
MRGVRNGVGWWGQCEGFFDYDGDAHYTAADTEPPLLCTNAVFSCACHMPAKLLCVTYAPHACVNIDIYHMKSLIEHELPFSTLGRSAFYP